MYHSTLYSSPVGSLTLAGNDESIVGLWLENQKYFGDTVLGQHILKSETPVLRKAKEWLDRYFAGEKPAVSELSLAPAGSDFRREVWRILCEIPYGEVTTYSRIAKRMAVRMNREKMSAQAVGGAVGHNPISIIIPCHRVIGTNGSLTGYAGGIGNKLRLLEFEGVDPSRFYVPAKGTAL
jgi:methylated-DNA-[protein]-cysteine S-methyltransferase